MSHISNNLKEHYVQIIAHYKHRHAKFFTQKMMYEQH